MSRLSTKQRRAATRRRAEYARGWQRTVSPGGGVVRLLSPWQQVDRTYWSSVPPATVSTVTIQAMMQRMWDALAEVRV